MHKFRRLRKETGKTVAGHVKGKVPAVPWISEDRLLGRQLISVVLSILNRMENQRSESRLEINEY